MVTMSLRYTYISQLHPHGLQHASPCLNFLLRNGLDHFGSKVIHCLHFSGLESQLPDLCPGCGGWSVYLYLHHLTLNDFILFPMQAEVTKASIKTLLAEEGAYYLGFTV